jgi:C-terminal processing protease CtpA/Prc
MVPQGLPQRPSPPFLAKRNHASWSVVLEDGRTVYLAYNRMTEGTLDEATRVRRLTSRPRVDRVILDLRHNPGGDYFTSGPLLDALRALPRRVRLVVLVGRTTFSAAENLAADLERLPRTRFVGEPTGGSPNLYGDPSPRQLPASGWNANVATRYWQQSRRGDPRLTLVPDLAVPYTAADFFAGRDPVLRRALR